MKKTTSQITPWIPVILWMILIFFLSAQSAYESNGLSTKFTQVILGFLGQVVPAFGSGAVDYSFFHHFVRKLTHFLLYLILGALSARALQKNGMSGWKPLVLAVLICAAYAATDELHQVFVPGRSGQISDVLLDSMGAMVGVVLYYPRYGRTS